MDLLPHIDIVPNFPKEGINFYDLQSLLVKPELWSSVVQTLSEKVSDAGADIILGIESRGFITGLPVAQELGLPFGMIRKAGKLPGNVVGQEYALEYGTDKIEIQSQIIMPGQRVAILDDLLATGGTMKAAGDLVRKVGGEIALGLCVIELHELGGREKFDFACDALCQAPLDPFSRAKTA